MPPTGSTDRSAGRPAAVGGMDEPIEGMLPAASGPVRSKPEGGTATTTDGVRAAAGDRSRRRGRRRGERSGPGLRLRLTGLSTALLALIGALLLGLAYLVIGQVIAALPQFPPGTRVSIEGRIFDAGQLTAMLVEQGRRTVLLVGFTAFPFQVAVGAVLSWVLIGRALRPLSVLTATARELSGSSLDRRIRLEGPRDEVAELADTFDEMLDRLEGAFQAERRFVANASHELRTPMAVIRTEIDVTLADPTADVAELRRMAEVVREATDSADRLLSALLVLARTQARGVRQVQPVDLAALVAPALHAVEGEVRARGLSVHAETGSAPGHGDPELLQRVVGNLVENAVRHNVTGGWLRVRTGRGTVGDPSAWDPAAVVPADGEVPAGHTAPPAIVVEVSSSGPEIGVATVDELFEPFRQGRRARTSTGGSGLGLSIVRAVVAAHDGALHAEPVPGGGLLVRVVLPEQGPASGPAPASSGSGSAGSGG
jgi:signal transduction histidine kinase